MGIVRQEKIMLILYGNWCIVPRRKIVRAETEKC
jgi:hypothetical protein